VVEKYTRDTLRLFEMWFPTFTPGLPEYAALR